MLLKRQQFASSWRVRWRVGPAVAALTAVLVVARPAPAHPQSGEDANRREGEAVLRIADAAMAGRPAPSDFGLEWKNDFFKAQPGTFVPFTITIERGRVRAAAALLYIRAAARNARAARGETGRFAFDAIFPVQLTAPAGQPIRIVRGFAVPAGQYDVYVVVRERPADPLKPGARGLRAAVLKRPLDVPDFWKGELSASTVVLANRIEALAAPVDPDDLFEHPYVIGQQLIEPASEPRFRRDRELILVFLIYDPSVTTDRRFDVQVEYHVFKRGSPAGDPVSPAGDHPPPRPGERYVSHTEPQRFTPATMGASFDPRAGQPLLAGQGILLSSFQEGEYRIGITVTDLFSRRTLSRDVIFTVVGS